MFSIGEFDQFHSWVFSFDKEAKISFFGTKQYRLITYLNDSVWPYFRSSLIPSTIYSCSVVENGREFQDKLLSLFLFFYLFHFDDFDQFFLTDKRIFECFDLLLFEPHSRHFDFFDQLIDIWVFTAGKKCQWQQKDYKFIPHTDTLN